MADDAQQKLMEIADKIADTLQIIYVPAWKRYMLWKDGVYVEVDDEIGRAHV